MALKEYGKDFYDFNSFAANVEPGDTVCGVPYNYVDFGVFVGLDHALEFSALIPNRFISKKGEKPSTAIPSGRRQEFRVQQIDKARQRITLSALEFEVGERKARPKDTTNYDEPIDNTKVVVPEVNKEITIYVPPNDPDDKQYETSRKKLKDSLNAIVREYPDIADYFSEMPDSYDRAEFIVDHSFIDGMPAQVFLRNLTFENRDKSKGDIRRLGLRLARQKGDFWDEDLGLPVSQTFLFEGRLVDGGCGFLTEKILVVGNSTEALAYEVALEVIPSTGNNRVQFMYDILNQMASITKYTSNKLTLWSDYLDWSERVSKLQIQGVKYVGVSFDRAQKQLVFELLFNSEAEFKKMQRILRRQEIAVFKNDISTDLLSFRYNTGEGAKRRPWYNKIDVGSSMGMVGSPYGMDVASKKLDIPISAKKDDDERILTLSSIQSEMSKPFFVSWGFSLSDDDLDKLDAMDGDISDLNDASFDDFIEREILGQYPKDGFLALSAVGDLALINRFKRAIDQIRNGESYNPHLEEWLFDVSQARLPDRDYNVTIDRWLNENIASNANQREAIEKMLRTKDLFLLQGPPGTGKTTVIAESIFQFVIRGERVLLSSQSNDAVDNALERLVKTPEIRAIRLMNSKFRRSQNDEDDSLSNLSERTALRYYYESLSDKISRETLNKWDGLQREIQECQTDLRNFNAIRGTIESASRDREEKQQELRSLQQTLQSEQQNLKEIRNAVEEANTEKRNLNEFKKFLAGEDADFALSEKQLDEVLGFCANANDSDYRLWDVPSNDLTTSHKNQYLRYFVSCVKQLEKLNKNVVDSANATLVSDDLDLKLLNGKASELKEKMDAADSDEEFDRLAAELRKVNNEIRNRKKQSQGVDCSLNEVQKQIVSQRLQEMLVSDKKSFIENLTAKVNSLNSLLSEMEQKLDSYQSNLHIPDEAPVTNNIKIVNGKISVSNETITDLTNRVRGAQESIGSIAQKYGIASSDDVDSVVNAIESRRDAAERDLKRDAVMQKNFGPLLEGFRQKLQEHIRNRKLLENDNDNYLNTYINSCNVVGMSCTADPRILTEKDIQNFDVVIIDEVSKATPPELLLPLMKAQKVILVGDHRQLPPMFKTNERSYKEIVSDVKESDDYTEAEKEALSEENFDRYKSMVTASLFKDYFERAPEAIKASLLTQYRMHTDIMKIINRFYDGKLVCGVPEDKMEISKAHHLTINNCKNKPFVVPNKHAFWIDSTNLPNGTPIYESHIGASTSACNFLEENIVIALLRKINDAYVKLGYGKHKKVTVGVISFYQLAVNNMRRKIKQARSRGGFEALDISTNTVDRFQGQEKNIIIASLVRSKEPGPNGTVSISKHVLAFERINVAFSRAQNLLFIVGSKQTFEGLEVTLPMMDKQETRTLFVYKNIMQDLYRNGGLVDASSVIDDEMARKTLGEYNNNKKSGKDQSRKNEKRYRG